jgi:hypothetical protein
MCKHAQIQYLILNRIVFDSLSAGGVVGVVTPGVGVVTVDMVDDGVGLVGEEVGLTTLLVVGLVVELVALGRVDVEEGGVGVEEDEIGVEEGVIFVIEVVTTGLVEEVEGWIMVVEVLITCAVDVDTWTGAVLVGVTMGFNVEVGCKTVELIGPELVVVVGTRRELVSMAEEVSMAEVSPGVPVDETSIMKEVEGGRALDDVGMTIPVEGEVHIHLP